MKRKNITAKLIPISMKHKIVFSNVVNTYRGYCKKDFPNELHYEWRALYRTRRFYKDKREEK